VRVHLSGDEFTFVDGFTPELPGQEDQLRERIAEQNEEEGMIDLRHALVTGASGFIGKHIVRRHLDAGLRVTGSVRAPARAEEVRAAVAPRLDDPTGIERLRFVELDLERDEGWFDALEGVDALVHTAPPFPMKLPRRAPGGARSLHPPEQ